MGQPVVRQKDPHAGCTLTCGISMDVRVTNVRVNGDQPAAAAGPTQCTMGEGAHGPGDPHVIFKPIGPAIAVGQPTACGGVESSGSSNVHLVGPGGGWGKALFDGITRAMGGVRMLMGVVEVAGGGALFVTPEPTMLTKVTGIVVGSHGLDDIQAGTRQLISGQVTETVTAQLVSETAQAAGADKRLSGNLGSSADIILSGPLGFEQGLAKAGGKLVEGSTSGSRLLQSGARQIVNPNTEAGWKDAENAYEQIRADTSDIAAISRNTGISENRIARIKDHVFNNTHQLDQELRQFDADPAIVNAWNRLQAGDFVQSDLDLLQHELFESRFESLFKTNYRTAHDATVRSGRTWNPGPGE